MKKRHDKEEFWMNEKIGLVEDDKNLNPVLSSYLTKEGYRVSSFEDGESAEAHISEKPDLWILDIMLPGMDGYELLGKIRKVQPTVPVIFISARDRDIDRVVGLEIGGDDYITKPFLPRELVLRVRRLLEKSGAPQEKESAEEALANIRLNTESREAFVNGIKSELTSKEFDLLLYFSRNQGAALSRDQILREVWGEDYYGSDRAVDDLIRRLRKKIPELRLETVYGYGYRVLKEEEER